MITVVGAGAATVIKANVLNGSNSQASDKVIITSDPRFEEPQDIINDMLAGLNKENMRKVISIADRKEAIHSMHACPSQRRCAGCRKRA